VVYPPHPKLLVVGMSDDRMRRDIRRPRDAGDETQNNEN
jgi:hypothetical protein